MPPTGANDEPPNLVTVRGATCVMRTILLIDVGPRPSVCGDAMLQPRGFVVRLVQLGWRGEKA